MEVPAQIAAQQAATQQAIALSVLKQSADAEKQVANLLEEAILSVSPSSRGGLLDTTA